MARGRFPWSCGSFLVALAVLVPAWSSARAADAETREFTVYVDGKPAGAARMVITRADDGVITVAASTDVKVTVLGVAAYRYSYQGREVWKDGKLQRLDSTCNDDGKKYTVSATAGSNGLRVTANQQERTVSADVWLTSYWSRPENKLVNQTIPIIDVDTGRALEGKLEFVGKEPMTLDGRRHSVLHYRLTGKVNVDLWYDSGDRLARQEWVEDGHKTVVELRRK